MPTINNYTFSEPVFAIEEQTSVINEVGQTATITISPNTGYEATASDFSAAGFDTAYISNVQFQQDGENVLCVITIVNTSIMPSNNLTLGLCVTGSSVIKEITIAGTYDTIIGNNVQETGKTNEPYTSAGSVGEQTQLFTETFSADPGYYFEQTPTAEIVIGNQTNYSVSNTPGYDAFGNLIYLQYSIGYTFPNSSVFGDKIRFNAGAEEIFIPTEEITAYNISTALLIPTGESRTITLYGVSGAQFVLSMTDSLGNTYSIDPIGVIPSNGVYSINIVFPSAIGAGAAAVFYTISLTGDLVSPFPQTLPIVLTQQIIRPEISLTGSSSQGITGANTVTVQGDPYSEEGGNILAEWDLNVSSGTISYNGEITLEDIIYTSPVGPSPDGTMSPTYPVTDSSTFAVVDATGLQAGDKFNANANTEDSDRAPFQYEIINITGTTITVTPNITITPVDGQLPTFSPYRQEGTRLGLPSATAVSVDAQNLTLSLNVPINIFGNNDVIFTVLLDNIINLVTSTPNSINLKYNSNPKLYDEACCSATTTQYYLDSTSFGTALYLYTDQSGTLAPSGVYALADGSGYRIWNGAAFTTSIQSCPGCANRLDLCYSSVSENDLCCGNAQTAVCYVASGETFLQNTGLYIDPNLQTYAPDGWYSDDINCLPLP